MNGAEISAIAALSGSALGGLTPIIGNYLVQRGQTEREMLERELGARQSLYSDFIQFATKIYVDATTKELECAGDLVALYALISRIRLTASTSVIEAAEEFAANVTKRYGEKAIPFEVMKNATLSPHTDPLNAFSSRCRDELRSLLGHK